MSHYDSEYYFICYQSAENRPILAADAATADLAYSSQALPASALPLQFINGALTESNKGIFSDSPPEILFHGSDIAVKHAIFQRLAAMELPASYRRPPATATTRASGMMIITFDLHPLAGLLGQKLVILCTGAFKRLCRSAL